MKRILAVLATMLMVSAVWASVPRIGGGGYSNVNIALDNVNGMTVSSFTDNGNATVTGYLNLLGFLNPSGDTKIYSATITSATIKGGITATSSATDPYSFGGTMAANRFDIGSRALDGNPGITFSTGTTKMWYAQYVNPDFGFYSQKINAYVLTLRDNGGAYLNGPLNVTTSITASTGTYTGNAFSVGVSTLVVYEGRVGIGTNAPSDMLHIKSGAFGGSVSAGQMVIENNGDNMMSFNTPDANIAYLVFGTTSDNDEGWISYKRGVGYSIRESAAVAMTILNGNVSIPAGGLAPYSRTETELKALTPPAAGYMYYDSTNLTVVVSSGTGQGALVNSGTGAYPTGW